MKLIKSPLTVLFALAILLCCSFNIVSCSKGEDSPPVPVIPLTLTISPDTVINIAYNTAATFNWTTNGTGVTVNGLINLTGSFTTPALKDTTSYTVISYSPEYAKNGLLIKKKVVVNVVPDPVDIYVAGFDNAIAYWKNNKETILAQVPGHFGRSYAIAVKGKDVYVAGYADAEACYWLNGTHVPLTPHYNATKATSIAISGDDVYMGGCSIHPGSNTGFNEAVYWKNGNKVVLEAGGETRCVNAIAVVGNDVYAAGEVGDSAVMWKNGVRTALASKVSYAYGIAVSGSDVYVSGMSNGYACYWKNGLKTVLPSSLVGKGYGIVVSGNDVYVAGVDEDVTAVYWKNGVKVLLDSANMGSNARSINLYNGDIYISGKYGTAAAYWKNGKKVQLNSYSGGPFSLVEATCMALIPH